MEEMEISSPSNSRKRRDNPTENDEIDNNRSVKRNRTRTMPEVAGKIACIELENFMCHKSLKMNFDVYEKNCSYIVGANGSGKSAIFASINIGLGGSGRSNERGKNVQDYIKEGEEDALIRIHLTNEGPNAIPEYDNIIIVERRISQKSSQFILKSRSGNREQILHKKNIKHELDLILQQFNIELDNPLSWLSQDRARQFLQSMKPEKLYELYRQSSEMDSTEQLFSNIDLLFKELTKVISGMDNEKKAKEEKYHQEKARFDAVTTLKQKKTMVQKLLWYQLWAPIRDCQNEIAGINEKLAENTNKRNVNLKLRDDFTKRIEQIEKGLTQKGQDREKLNSKTREHNDRVNEMKRNIRKLDMELNDNDTQIKIWQSKVRTVDAELMQGRKGLEELLGNTNRNLDAEKQTLLERQNEIVEQMQKKGEEKEKNATELRKADEDVQNERQIYQKLFSEYVQTDNQLKRTIDEKQTFERSKVNILNLFGQDMPKLVKLIDDNAHLFTKKPIGPIGNHVKLRGQRWADPVEYTLKGVMGVILCNSVEDRKVLDEICTNNQIRKPQIVTTNFTQSKFDVSENEPAPIYNTVARMIDVDEPTAFNFIVDRMQAESLLLFDQDEIARKEMYPNAPKNATKALTLTCSEVNPQRGRRPYQFVHNQFRSRIFANRAMANEARDFDGQIRALEQSKIQKNLECKKFESTAKSKDRADQLRQKRMEIENRLMELNQQRYGIEEDLRKLEDIMTSQDRIVNMQNSIQEFEEERKKYLAQLETKRTAYREIKEKMTEHQDKLDASQHTSQYFKSQFNQIQNEIESLQLQQRKIQQRMETIEQSLANHDHLERDYNSKLEEKRSAIERQQKEAESKVVEMQEELREIPEYGDGGQPNFENIPETGELKKQLQTIQREIRIYEENREEPLTAEQLRELQNEYINFKRQVKEWLRRYKILQRIIDNRKLALEAITASLPRKLEKFFKEYMNYRGFKGSIVVNDLEGTIHIHVETHKRADEPDGATPNRVPDKRTRGRNIGGILDDENEKRNTREKQIMQDLRGLSGGERSYTTACFIMSLWNCMESPFRLMDEFDVFMDMVNRRVIMELLADLAKNTKQIQFFFFTPQPIHELKRDEFEVFQLKKIQGRIFGEQEEQ